MAGCGGMSLFTLLMYLSNQLNIQSYHGYMSHCLPVAFYCLVVTAMVVMVMMVMLWP